MFIFMGCGSQKPVEQQEAVIMGEPNSCNFGGSKCGSTEPCKECGADGWCWCSACCVALSERPSDWQTRDEFAKSKARALAEKQGLPTGNTK